MNLLASVWVDKFHDLLVTLFPLFGIIVSCKNSSFFQGSESTSDTLSKFRFKKSPDHLADFCKFIFGGISSFNLISYLIPIIADGRHTKRKTH